MGPRYSAGVTSACLCLAQISYTLAEQVIAQRCGRGSFSGMFLLCSNAAGVSHGNAALLLQQSFAFKGCSVLFCMAAVFLITALG